MSKNKKKINYNKTLKIRKSNNDTLFKVDVKDRRILILYTGGTIGMVETIKGHIPKKGYLQRKLKNYLKTNNSKDSHEPLSKYDIISLTHEDEECDNYEIKLLITKLNNVSTADLVSSVNAKIQSIPIVESPWKYSFFVDLTFPSLKNYKNCFNDLMSVSDDIKEFWVYNNFKK